MDTLTSRLVAIAAVAIAFCIGLGLFQLPLGATAALVGLGVGLWLFLTWWNTPDSVTFKHVVQGALRDVRDILKLDVAARWVVANATSLAVFASGLVSMADPLLRDAILRTTWHGVPTGALALLAVTWLASLRRVH